MEEIINFLCIIYPLSPECVNYILKIVKFRSVQKDEIILKIGEVNQYLYFIKKGALHCFYYIDDKLVSDWFFFESETVVSIGSFYDQLPSEACIVALEDSELYYISKSEYDYLKRTFHDFCFVASVLLEKYLKIFHEHCLFIRKTPALKRYQLILKKRWKIVARVPGTFLATWLNMEPETLSRVRNAAAHPDKPND